MTYLNKIFNLSTYYIIKLLRGKFYADFFQAVNLWKIGKGIEYEQRIAQIYSQFFKKGDSVIDIGAHLGLHLKNFIQLTGKSGKVLAFEPLPFAYKEIKKKYSSSNVLIFNEAISNINGISSLFLHKGLLSKVD